MLREPHVEFVKAVVSKLGKLPQINPEVLNLKSPGFIPVHLELLPHIICALCTLWNKVVLPGADVRKIYKMEI